MLKLLCIKAPNYAELLDSTRTNDFTAIFVGNEYVAYDEESFEDGVYYKLVGFSPDEIYHSRLFAKLPDSTTDELQEAECEAIVNLETVLV
jgi:hypothetical protein